MARPKPPSKTHTTLAGSAQVFRQGKRPAPTEDHNVIVQPWQREVYRHVNICGEARYAATLFSSMAGRAELGISQAQALAGKASWVMEGREVDLLNEIAPTVRDRSRLIRDYMLHYVIAGECYLIARDKVETDPGEAGEIWEIVAVTELRRVGDNWEVRHENGNYIELSEDDPVIRLWNPDPQDRMKAWSPFRSLLPTLVEIEWLTRHIFTQVQSRLMSAGVWFLPDNLTFPPPPPESVNGGTEAMASMNDAELLMLSLAASSTSLLEGDEVAFPSVIMADPMALAAVDQSKLIKFWSEIDDAAMILRSDAVRRFALGMDMPPEQVLGSSGLAVTGAAGSAGSVNHWGVWANEEQTISAHIEPALDRLVGSLTTSVLRNAIEDTPYVFAYDTASLRMRQDRSKEAMEWYDRGVLKAEVALRETGFDPSIDVMDEDEFRRWMLVKVASGSASPEQLNESLRLLGVVLNVDFDSETSARGRSGTDEPPSLKDHPYEGPPRVQNDHSPAPFNVLLVSCEGLVLRALEKAGNRLLNDGKRGRDRDRSTPAHLAHITASVETAPEFDFTLLPTVLSGFSAKQQSSIEANLSRYCAGLYASSAPHTREALAMALAGA